jgi:hypothetical protein
MVRSIDDCPTEDTTEPQAREDSRHAKEMTSQRCYDIGKKCKERNFNDDMKMMDRWRIGSIDQRAAPVKVMVLIDDYVASSPVAFADMGRMNLFPFFQVLRNLKAYGELATGQSRGNAVPMEATGTEICMSNRCAMAQEDRSQ